MEGYSNGSIELEISNISLSSEGNYTWAISTNSTSDSETKWYVLGDINASKKTAKVNLTVQEEDILAILRKTDTAYFFIKDTNTNKEIISGLKLDLTLPPLYAFDYCEQWNALYITGGNEKSVEAWSGATYNIQNAYYKFEKITDEELINKYKQAKINKTSLSNIFSITKSKVESINGWVACTRDYSYPFTKIEKSKIPTEQGTYYLWVKAKDADSKSVYGCLIIDIDADGPVVTSIKVTSPSSGVYKTGQTVKIEAVFNEEITGSTAPTLKVKFGDSAERTLTNGTISGKYITYSYNIQESDKGQLATVSFTGGNIKDASGNAATITCPLISGQTIKANVEGTVTNNTENQDKTNNGSNNNASSNTNNSNSNMNSSSNSNNSANSSTNQNSTQDKTTATTRLPQTGEGILIIAMVAIVMASGIFAYIRYNKYKGI